MASVGARVSARSRDMQSAVVHPIARAMNGKCVESRMYGHERVNTFFEVD